MMALRIEVVYSERCGYSVEVNGETILECLAKDELDNLTMAEMIEIYNENSAEPVFQYQK